MAESVEIDDLVTCAGEGEARYRVTGLDRLGGEPVAWLVAEQEIPFSHGWEPVRKLTHVSDGPSNEIELIHDMQMASCLADATKIYKKWKRQQLNKMRCRDCQVPHPEDYMVLNNVWKLAGLKPKDGRVCLFCLSKRLRRELVIEDFQEVPSNAAIRAGYVMGWREGCENDG